MPKIETNTYNTITQLLLLIAVYKSQSHMSIYQVYKLMTDVIYSHMSMIDWHMIVIYQRFLNTGWYVNVIDAAGKITAGAKLWLGISAKIAVNQEISKI